MFQRLGRHPRGFVSHEPSVASEVDVVGAQVRETEIKGLTPRANFHMLHDILLLKVVRPLDACIGQIESCEEGVWSGLFPIPCIR